MAFDVHAVLQHERWPPWGAASCVEYSKASSLAALRCFLTSAWTLERLMRSMRDEGGIVIAGRRWGRRIPRRQRILAGVVCEMMRTLLLRRARAARRPECPADHRRKARRFAARSLKDRQNAAIALAVLPDQSARSSSVAVPLATLILGNRGPCRTSPKRCAYLPNSCKRPNRRHFSPLGRAFAVVRHIAVLMLYAVTAQIGHGRKYRLLIHFFTKLRRRPRWKFRREG